MFWVDFCFMWKLVDYDGDFFDIFLFVFDIWILNFVLMNLYYKVKLIFLSDYFCKVYYYGGVLCMLFDFFEVLCDVDVIYYFFDF